MLGRPSQKLRIIVGRAARPSLECPFLDRRDGPDEQVRVDDHFHAEPSHSGQAPNGLLNENMRGDSSSMLNPHSGRPASS
jgi:hypothetical protein